jgi:uncharacterized membrane-anchored protein YjiN (DUF445 family)
MSADIHVVEELDSLRDAHRRLRLKLMQRTALGLLLGMAALYLLALSQRDAHPAWGLVSAFAEAAMVGAIADWFAVVALFRHPMGIPIWHTAIIPNSKDDIGRNLGEFVENHFITEEAVLKRLRAANPAGLLSAWLLAPGTAPRLGRIAAKAAEKILASADDAEIGRVLRTAASRQLGELDVSAVAGSLADLLLAERKHQELLDGVLEGMTDYLADESNEPRVADFFIEVFGIDSAIIKAALRASAPRVLGSLQQSIIKVRNAADHPLRAKVDSWVKDFVLRLKADPDWQDNISRYQREMLASAQVEALLDNLWQTVKGRLQEDLRRDDPALGRQFSMLFRKIGETLTADAGLGEWLNQAVESGSAQLIRRYRGEAGKFIEAQLTQWTKSEMSERIELAIGRDLQFIRINGTLVGGLVGVAIYAVNYFSAHIR